LVTAGACSNVENELKTSKLRSRKVKKERVAVVESIMNKRGSNNSSRDAM
jgi:hypothetical protein